MMRYIEELRHAQQKAEEAAIQKEAELESFRTTGASAELALEGHTEIKLLLELLGDILKSREDADGLLKSIVEGEFMPSAISFRLDKHSMLDRLREVSVDLQRLKVDRLKAL